MLKKCSNHHFFHDICPNFHSIKKMRFNFFRNISIATKLIIIFLFLGIGSTIIVSVYSFYSARSSLIERTFDQLTSIRVVKKKRIEDFFSDRFRDINLYAKTIEVSKLLQLIEKNSTTKQNSFSANLHDFDQFLNLYVKAYGYYDKFIVGDTSDNIIYTSGIAADSLHTGKISESGNCIALVKDSVFKKKSINFLDFKNDPFNDAKPSYYLSIPVNPDGKKILGYVALLISTKSINDIMLENSTEDGLGETGESYLVGSDHIMRSESRFIKNSLMVQKVRTIATDSAFIGNTGTKIINDYRGISVLSSFGKLSVKGLNWVIIAEIDLKEAMIPVVQTRNDILYLSVLLVIFILGFTLFIARTISQPIIRLKNAAVRVGEGDFNTRVDISGKDEIGALADSFNSMTSKLKNTTDQLQEREERLRHFYEATVDGIILHEHGMPLLVNQALCKLTGFSEEELMKKSIDKILHDKIILPENIRKYEAINAYETECTAKDGSTFPVEVQEGFVDYKGRRIHATVIRNISQRREVENALKEERVKRLSALIDGQEMERERISRELHDGLGQFLIAIKLKLENIISAQHAGNRESLMQVQDMFDRTIDEIRKISDNLMPSILKEFGLETALRNLCKMMAQATGITIIFDSLPIRKKIDERTNTYLYRIAQESLNNSVKHAEAGEITLQLMELGNSIRLVIEDDGKGFSYNSNFKSKGNGIYNMRERVNMLGGDFTLSSTTGKGTSIEIKIPTHD